MDFLIKHPGDILCWKSANVSNDIWITILSYLKDIDYEPVSPNNLIIIMKMSLINKSLRNLITSNNFWILYNDNKYKTTKYNIYNCNEKFCRILNKINTFKIHKTFHSNYTYGINERTIISKIQKFYNKQFTKFIGHTGIIFPIINIQIDSECNVTCNENKCTFKIIYFGQKDQITACRKLHELCHIHDNISDSYVDLQNIFNYCGSNEIQHNNFIWFTIGTINDFNMTINFYAQNVMTNIRYLIHQIN